MKVNLGKQTGKKHQRPLVHDVTTTTDFGFCQPILNRRIHAQDTISLRFGQLVRLMPMPMPTFGTIDLRTYASFVPIEDIYHPYAAMLAGQSYNGVAGSYIPTKLPNSSLTFLSMFVFMASDIYFAERTSASGHPFKPLTYNATTYKNLMVSFWQDMVGSELISAAVDYVDAFYWDDTSPANLKPYCVKTPSDWSEDSSATNYFDFSSCDFVWSNNGGDTAKYIGFKFNNIGRALRKIIIGSGYQVTVDKTPIEWVRIFSYYKAWFDLFNPARDKTWKDTTSFHIVEYLEQMGENSLLQIEPADIFKFMYDELANCYYTADPDYIAAHIVGNRNAIVPGGNFSAQAPTAGNFNDVSVSSLNQNDGPHLAISSFGSISQPLLDVLRKITSVVNIHTALGGRVREFMRVMFGSDYLDATESNFIGSQILPIEAEGVFATAETSLRNLGDYAGKAVANTAGKNFKFTAKSEGFVVVLMAAVPRTGYAQGVDAMGEMLDKYSTYQPAFDGITLVPSRKNILYDIVEYKGLGNDAFLDYSGGFGNIPIYSATRYAKNILNGDMSLPSTRESFLPYTLDKLLTYPALQMNASSGHPEPVTFQFVQNLDLVASSIWRYIGKYRWIGNFDRIFYNENQEAPFFGDRDFSGYYIAGAYDDNFIVTNYVDLKVFGYPLPISDTFQTEAFDKDTIAVQKA